jgi:hypothetical protein
MAVPKWECKTLGIIVFNQIGKKSLIFNKEEKFITTFYS